MKKIIVSLFVLFVLFSLSACQEMFETDSSSVVFEQHNQLSSTSDSLYSVMGILSQVAALGERYVLTGELRGDLMMTTADAPVDMQNLSQFHLFADNGYADLSDYYAVINNCNYALTRMDTTLLSDQLRVMVPEWVAIRTFRAWTYWQLALLTGKVRWLTSPVLSVQEGLASYPLIGQEELAEKLIDELLPYTEARELNYGTIDSYNSVLFFIPVHMLLGDLLLFLNRYDEAALSYYEVIRRHNLTLSNSYTSRWSRITREGAYTNHNGSYTGEVLTMLTYSSNPAERHPQLVRYSYNDVPSIVPSNIYTHLMDDCIHYYSESNTNQVLGYFQGDLRGCGISAYGANVAGDITREPLNKQQGTRINKFMFASSSTSAGYDPQNQAIKGQLIFTRLIPVYRNPHVYLRLAEALNRTKRPTLAFAVLKYGLNAYALNDSSHVCPDELEYPFSEFVRNEYNANVGTASRGRGLGIPYDTDSYVIPELPTMADSMLYVEDCILDEMAAETAFEGNRFFDLLRVARHRDQFPSFMANRVSRRFDNPDEVRQRLMQPKAWYVQ